MTAMTWRRALRPLTMAAALTLSTALSAQAQVELEFWDQIWGPESYAPTAQALVDAFNASQSEIHVTYRSMPWSNWYETYVTAIASGSAPDISTGGGFQAVQFYDMGAVMPVDELMAQMEADGALADYAPATLEALKFDGHYVALPWNIDIRVMHYRKDLLEAAGIAVPTTWDEFRAAAQTLSAGGSPAIAIGGGADPNGVHWLLWLMINNNAGLFNADGTAGLTSEGSLQALNFLGDLVADGSVDPASAGLVNDDVRGKFFAGETAFYLGGPNGAAGSGDQAVNIGVVPPLVSASGTAATIAWINNIMIYADTEHPAEAMTFLRWWSENQAPLWVEGGVSGIPARLSFQAMPDLTGNANVAQVMEQWVPAARPMSAVAGGTFPQLNEIDGDGFLMAVAQRILQGEAPADAVQPAQDHLAEIMAD